MTASGYERELVNLFRNNGWHAQRAGSSGGGTTADLPDVTIAQDGYAFAIEHKTIARDETYIYADADGPARLWSLEGRHDVLPVGSRAHGAHRQRDLSRHS